MEAAAFRVEFDLTPRRKSRMDLQDRAKSALMEYLNQETFNIDDPGQDPITFEHIYIVWFSKTLQNWKALGATTFPDGMYYELTYNGDTKELYIDAYKKIKNTILYPPVPVS